ncbi:hypothetical protein HNP81_004060 [Peribacillus huizhouensis]|uniref:Uncharacterized protein n=1 Tax=Peribacillus huizhouensis TaxID=1501239 RepID=A0ABR6CUP2_9BACI|nr:hypothetical protein [Peribacillus huizhouensis]
MRYIRFFLYFFFIHTIIGLCFFYGDNFRKPFSDFSNSDIARAIIIIIIMGSYFGLASDVFIRFNDISKTVKVLISVVSFFVSIFIIGLFLSVYFEA